MVVLQIFGDIFYQTHKPTHILLSSSQKLKNQKYVGLGYVCLVLNLMKQLVIVVILGG